jgi:hypothetical protein
MSSNDPHQPMMISGQPPLGGSAPSAAEQAILQQQAQMIQHLEQQLAQQQQQQQQMQQQLQQQQAGPSEIQQMAALLIQQAEAQRIAQRDNTMQLLAAQTMGPLEPFLGKGSMAGTQTEDWLRRAERWFSAREQAGLGANRVDATRLIYATEALREDAIRWYEAIPEASRPTTWAAFRKALLQRFSSSATESIRLDRLRTFCVSTGKLRDKMTMEGIQSFLARFQQLAAAVPDWLCTAHNRLELLGRALPPRLSEAVWTEHRKDPALEPLIPLHQLVDKLLSKAYSKEYAHSHSGQSGAGGSAAAAAGASPMDLDALQLCATQFDVSMDEARRYLQPGEGWASFDTDGSGIGSQSAAAAGQGSAAATPTDALVERLCAAVEARFVANRNAPRGQSQRRNVPSDLAKEVPELLASARKAAGLCIKCGVTKYEPGSKGHNSRTCHLPTDKTTSAVEGKRRAGKDF